MEYDLRRLQNKPQQGNGNPPENIPDNSVHRFKYHSHDSSGSNDLYNLNIVKTSPSRNTPGVGGFLPYDASGEPPPSTSVYLTPQNGGDSVAMSSTDTDGYFVLPYRHRGPVEVFDVNVPDFSLRSGLAITNNNADEVVDFGLVVEEGIYVAFNEDEDSNSGDP